MSLVGAAIAMAVPMQVSMDWSYQGWSPESYVNKDLSVFVNVGLPSKPGTLNIGKLNYRMVSETKGFGVYEIGFAAQYFTRTSLTEKSTRLLAYGVWYSVNEFKDYTEYWQGYALVTADSDGFRLEGTAPRGYMYLLDAGLWGANQEIKGDSGWRSFGTFLVQQNIKG
jgi:hypothetical protein